MLTQESQSLLAIRSRKKKSVIEDKMNKIGMGPYQYISTFIASFAFFSEAAQITSLSLTVIILKDDWELSATDLGILGGMAIGGTSIGSAISTAISDDWGRLSIIKINLLGSFLSTIPIIFTPDFWIFSVSQLFLGFFNGLSIPVIIPYILEICPSKYRSMMSVVSQLMFVIGQLYVVLLSLVLIPELDSSRWREIFVSIAVVLLLASILIFTVPKESVFFSMNQGNNEKGIRCLQYMAKINKEPPLYPSDIDSLRHFFPPFRATDFSKLKELFHLEYLSVTVLLSALWTLSIYCMYGLLFSLRIIMDYGEEDGEAIYALCAATLLQVPVILVCIWLVHSRFIARRIVMMCAWFLVSVFSLLATLVVDYKWIHPVSVIIIITLGIIFNVIFPYTCEVYHTRIRVMGFGFHSIVSRITTISAPIAMIELTNYEPSFTYMLISVLALAAIAVVFALPYETKWKSLDAPNEKATNK